MHGLRRTRRDENETDVGCFPKERKFDSTKQTCYTAISNLDYLNTFDWSQLVQIMEITLCMVVVLGLFIDLM